MISSQAFQIPSVLDDTVRINKHSIMADFNMNSLFLQELMMSPTKQKAGMFQLNFFLSTEAIKLITNDLFCK